MADLFSARLNLVEAISSGRAYSLASLGIWADFGADRPMFRMDSRHRAA
ncbi:MAG: hypothetical protein ACR2JJ_00445 [Sphingomicrobium sp.]